MLSFFLNLARFAKAIIRGFRTDPDFRTLAILLLILIISGTSFYYAYEGWSLVDAFYFTVITMATIGYGDLSPSSDLSKIFTVILAFLSIGVFVGVVTKIVTFLTQKPAKNNNETKAD